MDTFLIAVITFAATNVDDIFLLMLFFSDSSFQPRFVVTGQYLGFGALVLVSLLGFVGSLVIPSQWLGLLGLAPIFIGVRKLGHQDSPVDMENEIRPPIDQSSKGRQLRSALHPKVYTVAAVTIANGGDNIGIYTPLFANSDIPRLILILGIFIVLVAVWCLAGYGMARQPSVARVLSRSGHTLVPLVLIGLGIYIILESGILGEISGR